MGNRAPEYVREAYAEVREALKAFAAFARCCHDIVPAAEERRGRELLITAEQTAGYTELRTALVDVTTSARRAIDSLKPFISALDGPVTAWAGQKAASLAEAVVKTCEHEGRVSPVPEDLDIATAEGRKRLQGKIVVYPMGLREGRSSFLDVDLEDAALEKEGAQIELLLRRERVRVDGFAFGLWRVEGDEVLFEGRLRELHGIGEAMLALLIRADGRRVTYEDLADRVWLEDTTTNHTIQQGKAQLLKDLRKLGHPEVADAIRRKSGGYRLAVEDLQRAI
ncbi:MAG: hypothetical protein ABFS86_04155 [Planctomycetota bacterium]